MSPLLQALTGAAACFGLVTVAVTQTPSVQGVAAVAEERDGPSKVMAAWRPSVVVTGVGHNPNDIFWWQAGEYLTLDDCNKALKEDVRIQNALTVMKGIEDAAHKDDKTYTFTVECRRRVLGSPS